MSQKTNCEYCDGTITTVREPLPFKSKALGAVVIPAVEQHKCSQCGNTVISLDEADKVTTFVRNKEQEAINNLPACDFISLNQAAELLGITKQAFSKHPRIKRGFIYSITIDDKKFFYKRSVEALKATKDGRVSLSWRTIINQIEVNVQAEQSREIPVNQMQQQLFTGMLPNMFCAQQKNNSVQIDTSDKVFIPAALYDQHSSFNLYKTTR